MLSSNVLNRPCIKLLDAGSCDSSRCGGREIPWPQEPDRADVVSGTYAVSGPLSVHGALGLVVNKGMKAARTAMVPDDLGAQAGLMIDGVTGLLFRRAVELAGTSWDVTG